ncbi:MAG: ATP-binding protein [Acidobacteria bacterium]|nr:ATP-binding protein [Acidobacteriota bacterium]
MSVATADIGTAARALQDLHPLAPRTLEETGLSHGFVTELLLKIMHFGSDYTGLDLARRVGLEFPVIEPVLDSLKRSHQCEIYGGTAIGAPSYRYRISEEGRRMALLFLQQSRYAGVAPVPLRQYREYMERYRGTVPRTVNRDRVRDAFSHLVISQKVLDQVGPAVAAGHSMFVYGPPGNGKTVIAQAIQNLMEGEIAIPHALEVEGQIIKFFDPINHEVLGEDPSLSRSLMRDHPLDGRWVRCRRPMVMVGGELTLEALDLAFSPTMGLYSAPVQAMANGGVLVIDDFGRQHCSPRDLLNRWIVPLESLVDFLTLQTGQKFDLPFMVLVVFATNIRPADLVDEAFLRRIHYKVFAESPTRADFVQIFENYCRQRNLAYDPAIVDHLLNNYFRPRGIQARGCHPRDLIEQALAHAEYTGQPLRLTNELLEAACAGYFVDDTDNPTD